MRLVDARADRARLLLELVELQVVVLARGRLQHRDRLPSRARPSTRAACSGRSRARRVDAAAPPRPRRPPRPRAPRATRRRSRAAAARARRVGRGRRGLGKRGGRAPRELRRPVLRRRRRPARSSAAMRDCSVERRLFVTMSGRTRAAEVRPRRGRPARAVHGRLGLGGGRPARASRPAAARGIGDRAGDRAGGRAGDDRAGAAIRARRCRRPTRRRARPRGVRPRRAGRAGARAGQRRGAGDAVELVEALEAERATAAGGSARRGWWSVSVRLAQHREGAWRRVNERIPSVLQLNLPCAADDSLMISVRGFCAGRGSMLAAKDGVRCNDQQQRELSQTDPLKTAVSRARLHRRAVGRVVGFAAVAARRVAEFRTVPAPRLTHAPSERGGRRRRRLPLWHTTVSASGRSRQPRQIRTELARGARAVGAGRDREAVRPRRAGARPPPRRPPPPSAANA